MVASDHLNREEFWHLTDDPRFSPRADHVPEDNTLAIRHRESPGLFLTDSPERWVNAHGYARPFAAQVSVPQGVVQKERWGGERFVPGESMDQVQVNRVIPLDAHARETYGAPGWIEEGIGTAFDTGEIIEDPGFGAPMEAHYPYKGYTYDGPDVRDMSDEEAATHIRRANEYRESRR